jgi:outer membrane lipoprotein-sorting protein
MTHKSIFTLSTALVCLLFHPGNFDAVAGDEDQILAVAQKMEAAFKGLEDYSCEVEQIFYQNGAENQRYRFKFYFKKGKKIRVDFSHPHPGLTVIYKDGETKATVIPFRSSPALKFRLSVDNPLLKTLAGQRINQTDMGYFIDFLSKNLKKVAQKENTFHEDEQRVEFIFRAMDYIEERSLEKYRISISKKYWLPIRIERYSSEGKLLEVSDIKNYILNAHLEDRFFLP